MPALLTFTVSRLPEQATEMNIRTAYLAGAVVVFDDPSGAACIPGGLWPWGLSAGAPPEPVLIGPVQPCGCAWPFSSGGVWVGDELVCAGCAKALSTRQSAAKHKIALDNLTRVPPMRSLNLQDLLPFRIVQRNRPAWHP